MTATLSIHGAFPPAALAIVEALQRAGYDAVIVGGPVRDFLRGGTPHDIDLATSAAPDVVRQLFPRTFVQGSGERHGTIGVVGPDGETYEVTTFRQDVDTDGRHASVAFTTDLATDLERRDFTINAIALRPLAAGVAEVVDPFGGREDLAAGLLRAVGDPDRRFAEDYLRILRAYRFAARYGFDIDDPTRAAMRRAMPGVTRLSAERVRDELSKLLEQASAPGALVAAFTTMAEDGLVALVLPELEACRGVTQNAHHAFDVFRHIIGATDAAPREPSWYRWVLLLHDIGKPATRTTESDGRVRFLGHELVGADMADIVLERLRFPTADRLRIAEGVRQHMRLMHVGSAPSARALRRIARDLRQDVTLDDLLAIRVADKDGSGVAESLVDDATVARLQALIAEIREAAPPVRVSALAITGRDVMEACAIPPGPAVGRILAALLDVVVDDPTVNTPDALRARAAALYQRLALEPVAGAGDAAEPRHIHRPPPVAQPSPAGRGHR